MGHSVANLSISFSYLYVFFAVQGVRKIVAPFPSKLRCGSCFLWTYLASCGKFYKCKNHLMLYGIVAAR